MQPDLKVKSSVRAFAGRIPRFRHAGNGIAARILADLLLDVPPEDLHQDLTGALTRPCSR